MLKLNRFLSGTLIFIYLFGLVFIPVGSAQAVSATLVINEVDYDQTSTDTAEFIEIKNVSTASINLDLYSVEFVNGNGGAIYRTLDLPNYDLPAGDYYVICANNTTVINCDLDGTPDVDYIQNGAPDALAIRLSGTLVDAVSYEGDTVSPYTEGSGVGLADIASDPPKGISRCSDGADTDQNNVDFLFLGITPGAANSCTTPTLEIEKTAPATVSVNEIFTYTLAVTNTLGLPLTNVVITDTLPAGVTVQSISDSGVQLPGGVISWTVLTLADGAQVNRTVSVQAPAAPTTLTNSDYGVWATEWPTRVVGSPVNTTVTGAATNPTGVGEAIPSTVVPGFSVPLLMVAVTPGANPASTGLGVVCDLSAIGGLPNQAFLDDGVSPDAAIDGTFSYEMLVPASIGLGAKSLSCTISDAQGRTGSASIGLTAAPAFVVGKTARSTVNVGQTLTYTLSIKTNLDPSATNLVITDSLPLSVTFQSASDGGALTGNVVRWDVDSLAYGATFSPLITVTAPVSETTLTNSDYGAWASEWTTRTVGSPVNTTVVDPNAITPIATARAFGALWEGTIQGNVTVPQNVFATRSFAIQDSTGGMYIYPAVGVTVPPIALGDVVRVSGRIKNYNNLLEFDPVFSVTRISSGVAPAPEIVATSAVTPTQGKLVQVTGTATWTGTAPGPTGGNFTFYLNDGSGRVAAYRYGKTGIDMTGFTSPMSMTLTGFSGAFNTAQINPRFQSDVIDLRPPTVVSTVPTNGATGVSLYYPLTATFSKAMASATITTTSFTLSDSSGLVSGAVAYNAGTKKASFTPDAPLSPNTLYTAILTTAIQDIYGIALAAPYTWSFTTGDADSTAPTIVGRSPAPAETGVLLSANVLVTFSEDISPASLDSSNFVLRSPFAVVPGALSYNASTFVVTLDPNTQLLPSTLYTMTVTSAVADWAGNPLVADDVWTFETQAEQPMLAYLGDLHNHTGYSDGSGTPNQALAAGKAAGFDFMAISDHSYAITDPEWADTLTAVTSYTVDSDFVALRAFEYTQGAEGHINVYNTVRHAVRTNTGCTFCDYTPNLEDGSSVIGFYHWLAITGTVGLDTNGTVMQFNHPGWINFNDWAYHPEVSATARLEEVGNGNGSSYMFSEEQYIRSLDYGWKVGATNNADTHTTAWGVNTNHRTGVLMQALTKQDLLEALRLRRTYATEDKNYIFSMKANGLWMGSEIANTGAIDFEIKGSDPDGELPTSVQLITNLGNVAASTAPGTADFTWSPHLVVTPGIHYFYVKVTQADGDRIVSSPVWTEGFENIAITDISIEPTLPTIWNPSLLTVRVTNRIAATRSVTVTLDVNGSPINPSKLVLVPANGDAYANFSWQPTVTGAVTVTASLVGAPAGDNPDDNTAALHLTVTDQKLPLILIDAGKGNVNAAGSEFNMFIDDLSAHGYNVLKNLDTLTASDLVTDVVKLLIITAPVTNYSAAELVAISDFIAGGGSLWLCGLSDYADASVAGRMNAILDAIETGTGATINMRINDDEIIDGNDNNGYPFGVRWSNFPSAFAGTTITTGIGVNVENITSWSMNSLTGHSTTEPLTSATPGVQIVIQGDLETGYSLYKGDPYPNHTSNVDADSAGDLYKYNPGWEWPNDPAEPPVDAIPVPMSAVTDLPGDAGRIMLYGDSSDAFTSFAYTAGDGLQNELFNLESVMWLVGQPLTKSTIAQARAQAVEDQPDNLDRLVWVEGKITAAYGEFFNVLYVQDGTGGITVHAPAGDIDPAAFKRGTTVRVVGTVDIYNGDTEIQFFEAEMVQVIPPGDGPEVAPLPFSTHDAGLEANEGWLGVVTGTVTSKPGIDTLIVNDGSGPVRVFIGWLQRQLR